MHQQMAANEVLQGRRGEEIFLAQAQRLAGRRLVAGVENARNAFGMRAGGEGADMVAPVERRQLDRIDRAGRPEPQRVGMLALPADDRRVVGDRQHGLARMPDILERARLRHRPPPVRQSRRTGSGRRPPAVRIPRGCPWRASLPAPRAASRPRSSGETGHARSGCRSRRPGRPTLAIDSMKQAASRPRPPLPSAASGSIARMSARSTPSAARAARADSVRPRLVRPSISNRPIRNSTER